MPRTRPPYAPEFRRQIVEMVRAGRTPEELSREFEPTAQTIHNWVKHLKIEREILKKAAAWFAQETDSVPPKHSSS